MRALFGLLGILLLGLLTWMGFRHGERVYCRLLLNRATHAFLAASKTDAIRQAEQLLGAHPHYQPALEAAVTWMTAARQFGRALEIAGDYATTASLGAEARYNLAVCAYETGREGQAARLFETLTSAGQDVSEVPMQLVRAYLAMSRGSHDVARTTLESSASRFEGNLFYHSVAGLVCYSRGEIVRAAAELNQAMDLGESNPRARLFLAICQAMRGDVPDMERLLDALDAEGIQAYDQARAEIGRWLQHLETSTYITPSEQSLYHRRILNLRLADAAVAVRRNQAAEAEKRLADLAVEYSDHLGLITRRGLLLERHNQLAQALALYQQEADRYFLAAYKVILLNPKTDVTSENAMLAKFLSNEALILDARAMNPNVGIPADRGWELFCVGDFTRSFTINSTGRYAISLIARGAPSEGIWPVVDVCLDGKMVFQQYINSPVWDLFETDQTLLAGRHSIRLFFSNGTTVPVKGDIRKFYLDRVIIRPARN